MAYVSAAEHDTALIAGTSLTAVASKTASPQRCSGSRRFRASQRAGTWYVAREGDFESERRAEFRSLAAVVAFARRHSNDSSVVVDLDEGRIAVTADGFHFRASA